MQDRQQRKRCAVKWGKEWSLPSIFHRYLGYSVKGSGAMDNHYQFLTKKLTQAAILVEDIEGPFFIMLMN